MASLNWFRSSGLRGFQMLPRLLAAVISVCAFSSRGEGAAPASRPATAAATEAGPAAGTPRWRAMPLRSQLEFQAGRIGGEGLQHLHGLARSVSQPDIIYLAHDCGQFWRSTDNGLTWRKCLGIGCWPTAAQSVEVDPADPNVVVGMLESGWNYLVADFEGLYRSTDGGQTWRHALKTKAPQQHFHQHNIAFDPSSVAPGGARRWYASFADNAIFRSEDGGATWTSVAELAGIKPLYAVHAHPSDGKTVYIASGGGLLVSRQRGADPRPLGDLPPGEVSAVAIHPTQPRRIWAVVKGKGLYESADGGETFSLLKEWNAAWFFINPGHPRVMYLLGRERESLVSADGGKTWEPIHVELPLGWPGRWQSAIAEDLSGVLPDGRDPNGAVAFSRARLWRTGDGGRNWIDSSTLFTGYAWGFGPGGVAFHPQDANRFMLSCFDAGPIWTGSRGDWFERRIAPPNWSFHKQISWTGSYHAEYQPAPDSRTIVATIGNYLTAKLMRSTDEGLSWTLVGDANDHHHFFLAFHPGDPNWVFSDGQFSRDGGATWQPVPFLEKRGGEIMGLAASRPDTLYAILGGGREIVRSDDRGQTWRSYAKTDWPLTGLRGLPTFCVDGRDANVVYALAGDGDLARFDGVKWRSLGVLKLAGAGAAENEKVNLATHNMVNMVAFDPRRPEILYATTNTGGLPYVFRSRDAGTTWEDITSNLPRNGRGGLVVSPHTGELFHGTLFGTWIYPPPYAASRTIYDKLRDDPAQPGPH
jgi:photosystem II stability/assembly factor-like uncharacterized protein